MTDGPEREPGDDTDEIAEEPSPKIDFEAPMPAHPVPIRVAVDNAWRVDLDVAVLAGGIVKPKSSLKNALLALSEHPGWKGAITRDAFRDKILLHKPLPWGDLERPSERGASWSDSDTSRLAVWLERELGVAFSPDKCDAAIVLAAERCATHAVREYLKALRWDEKPRIDGLFHAYFGAEASDYTCAVSTSFLIGAIARVMRPGCQLDTLPILEGDQGIGKSTGVRALAGEWFSDSTIDFGSKDSYQQLLGVWLYELSELDALNRRDVARVKAYVSSPTDRYRPSYGRRTIDVPRQVAFIGTVNPRGAGYLSDDTGNRRFFPIKCGAIDVEALRRDRDQLWAEAFHRFKLGEPWHLSAARAAEATEQQEERRIPDPWEEDIAKWLAGRINTSNPVTTSEVLNGLEIEPKDHDRFQVTRVGACMKVLGWTRRRVRVDGERNYLYFPDSTLG